MTQYYTVNRKLPNSQLITATKNITDVALRLSKNMIPTNETNFPHNLILTKRQTLRVQKAIANNLDSMKLSKTQLSKIIPSASFLGRLLGWLVKVCLPLMKNVLTMLSQSLLITLGITATAAAADVGIH